MISVYLLLNCYFYSSSSVPHAVQELDLEPAEPALPPMAVPPSVGAGVSPGRPFVGLEFSSIELSVIILRTFIDGAIYFLFIIRSF